MKNLSYLALFLLIVTSVEKRVVAADSSDSRPCRDEVKKICPDQKFGAGLGQCIQRHQGEFSQECQAKFREGRAKMKDAIEDCKGDVKKFCASLKPGGGKILECLTSNEEKLSEACKGHVDQGMAMMKDKKEN